MNGGLGLRASSDRPLTRRPSRILTLLQEISDRVDLSEHGGHVKRATLTRHVVDVETGESERKVRKLHRLTSITRTQLDRYSATELQRYKKITKNREQNLSKIQNHRTDNDTI